MLRNKLLVFKLFLGLSVAFAQSINSPYSRFGIGDLTSSTNAFYKSMGGLSNSYASKRFINYSNPALLSSTSMTSFEVGLGMNVLQAQEGNLKSLSKNINFEYLNLAFPITKRYTFGFGVTPYSQVNYSTKITTPLDSESETIDTYKGEGGLSKMSFINSYSLIKDTVRSQTLSIGVDASLLVGSIEKSNESLLRINNEDNISYTSIVNSNVYRGMRFNIGTAYRKEIFVGDDFETIKTNKCSDELQGKVVITPRLNYDDQIALTANSSRVTKYAIIYPKTTDVRVDISVKNDERRELLITHYNSFIKAGYGVLILKEAEHVSYSDLKNDYLDNVKKMILEPSTANASYENDTKYSTRYLRYGSGIFVNVGASYELQSDINVTGSEQINRVRTTTGDAFESYILTEFDNQSLQLPSILKFGLSIDKPERSGTDLCGVQKKSTWLLGADLTVQNWANYSNLGISSNYSNTMRAVLGGSFSPNPSNIDMKFNTRFRKLLNVLKYQGGVYYQSLPYQYASSSVSEIGINFGFTLPTNFDGGLMTWNFGLATRGSELKENYFKIGLGLTLNENGWFRPVRVGR